MSHRRSRFAPLVFALVLLAATTPALAQQPRADDASALPPGDPIWQIGSRDAPIIIEEYSDFQCPYCATLERTQEDAIYRFAASRKDIRYVIFDIALARHPAARSATLAARCAAAQGRYREARKALMERQEQWSAADAADAAIRQVVAGTVSDPARLGRCIDRSRDESLRGLAANHERALAAGVQGVPTVIVRVGGSSIMLGDEASVATIEGAIDRLQSDVSERKGGRAVHPVRISSSRP